MKTLFRITLSISLVLALALAVGCGKKENPTTPATTTNPPAQQVSDAQSIAGYGTGAIGFTKGFSGGLSGWTPGTTAPKAAIGITGLAELPKWDTTGWQGPTNHTNYWNPTSASGWYYDTLLDSTMVVKIWAKFKPDTVNPVRVDWEYNYTTADTVLEFSAYCSTATGTTHNGGWYVGYSIGTNTLYYWRFTWSNVTNTGWEGNPRLCSGQFEYTSNHGVSGSFTFTNGSGTGSASINSTIFVNYVFNNDGTGHYTIVGYTTQYPFNW
jgi:hypothetical protein